jgi:hypothetical protein
VLREDSGSDVAVPLRIVARPFQNKLLERRLPEGYSACMKHLDSRQTLISLVLLAIASGPLTAQQLFVNAASGADANPGQRIGTD